MTSIFKIAVVGLSSVCLSVCMCVCWSHLYTCKNGPTDRDAVWRADWGARSLKKAMRPFVKIVWPLVITIKLTSADKIMLFFCVTVGGLVSNVTQKKLLMNCHKPLERIGLGTRKHIEWQTYIAYRPTHRSMHRRNFRGRVCEPHFFGVGGRTPPLYKYTKLRNCI